MPGDARGPRSLGLRHVYAICTGAMFSSGFFLLPGLAADETGPSIALAYLLAGLLVLPAVLSTAELSTAFPRAGGPYHFLRRSLGPSVATIGALGLFVAMVLKAAFALVGIGAYLSIVAEVPTVPLAVGLAAAFTVLNVLGTRESARLQLGLVMVLLVVLVTVVALGGVEASRRGADQLGEQLSPFFTDGAGGLVAAAAMLFVAYAGLLQVASVAGEVEDPQRTIPRGLLLSLATATTLYVAGSAVMVTLLAPEDLRDDPAPVAAAVAEIPLPLGTGLVVAAALAAFASTGNAGIMSASRYPMALARDGLLWSRFARLGRFGTPTAAVLATGGITAGAIALLDVEGIARFGSAFVLVVFALVNLSVVVLRSGRVPGYRPAFRSPLHPWLQLAGIVASAVLIIDLGLPPAVFAAGVVVVGLLWHRLRGGHGADADEGVAHHLLHRLRQRRPDDDELRRLQEHGPRHEDLAPDLIEEAAAVVLDPGATFAEVVSASTREAAAHLGVDEAEIGRWTSSRRHLTVEPHPDRVVIHLVLLDTATRPQVSVAWAPPGDRDPGDGDGDGDGSSSGRVAVIVAGAEDDRPRLTRIASLLAAQIGSGEPLDEAAGDPSPEHLRRALAADASRRQGAAPPG